MALNFNSKNNYPRAARIAYEKIAIGVTKSFPVTITPKRVKEFAKLSGDWNPLHASPQFAAATRFKQPIAHGMLLASFFSRLVGMHLPGERALYMAQSVKFKKPVYPGERVIVSGMVTAKQDAKKLLTIEMAIKNHQGEISVEGEAQVMVME